MTTIKQFSTEDADLWLTIRRASIANNPGSFAMPDPEKPEETWDPCAPLVINNDTAVFGSFGKDGACTGIVKIEMIDWRNPVGTFACLGALWIAPESRGQDLALKLMEACLEWANKHPTCETVTLARRESNHSCIKAIEACGFLPTGEIEEGRYWGDGNRENNHWYERPVKTGIAP